MTHSDVVSNLDIQTVDIDGQLLRVGIRRGSDASPPLVVFNGIGANLELVEPFVDALDDVGSRGLRHPGRRRLARAARAVSLLDACGADRQAALAARL